MRSVVFLFFVLLANTLSAQFEYADQPTNLGQAIGVGATIADLQRRLEAEQAKVQSLEGELSALRAQLRATPQPEPAKTPKPLAKIVSAVRCDSCPKIKAWLKPWLLRNGFAVTEQTHTDFLAGKIYPYVEIEVCNGNTCRIETVMVPDRFTPFTTVWFERQMEAKGLYKDDFVPAPAGD